MVKTYVCDDGKFWRDDVGTVQTSSESGLDNGDINFAVGKVSERHSCRQFKKGWFERLVKLPVLGNKFYYKIFVCRFAVNSDSLAEVKYVRRGVQTCPVTGRLEDGGECVGRTSLAVGTSYVNRAETAVRVPEVRNPSEDEGRNPSEDEGRF